ncbi:MAG: hypothetical protein ACYTDW_08345 [Planctomycetota bacterium]|jgi:hypothetical protein
MATEDTIQNLIRLDRLYFRALRSSYAKTTFYINRKELLVLGISTVKELKLFDEGSWGAHVSRVKWNQQEDGKAGVIYRTDLLRMAKAGDLEHIPGKAEIDKVYFKTACPLPILSIRERLQELRLDMESDISADILVMCKWPGRDVINSINLNAQDPDVLMRINRIEEKHLSCFRMLKRVIQGKQPNKALMAMTVPDETMQEKDKAEDNFKITKLTDFITDNCEDTLNLLSKVNRIHEFVKHGKILFMPKPINKPKGNETKLYYEEELRKIWPQLKLKIKSLPNLKA